MASADGLTERASTFGRAEVIKEIAGALPDGGTRTQIEHLAETFLRSREVISLLPTPTPNRSTNSTVPSMLPVTGLMS